MQTTFYIIGCYFHFDDNNRIELHNPKSEPWKVTLVDTGERTETGGRLKKIQKFLNDQETFCFTYGDGLSDVPIDDLIEFHKENQLATLTAVKPPGRYGALKMEGNVIKKFQENLREIMLGLMEGFLF